MLASKGRFEVLNNQFNILFEFTDENKNNIPLARHYILCMHVSVSGIRK